MQSLHKFTAINNAKVHTFKAHIFLNKTRRITYVKVKVTAFSLFKRQPHKMVKQIQTIRRLLQTKCLSVFDHFVALALKGLKEKVA